MIAIKKNVKMKFISFNVINNSFLEVLKQLNVPSFSMILSFSKVSQFSIWSFLSYLIKEPFLMFFLKFPIYQSCPVSR